MNAVTHFVWWLSFAPIERVLELRELEIEGPMPLLALVTTRNLRDLVGAELERRRLQGDLTAA
jgi:hypothetical protein